MCARFRSVAAVALISSLLLLTACTAGPRDIRVTSVTDVNLRDQTQFEWAAGPPPYRSKMISRIDFTTSTDLLAFAKEHDFNVSFVVGPCEKGEVKDNGAGLGAVYWGKTHIYFGTKDAPGYAEAIAKGPPFTYQAYAERLEVDAAHGPLCFALAGGAMFGGKLRSNVATIPPKPSN
jgi:hypothetical protein